MGLPPTPPAIVANMNDSIGDITMREDGSLFCRYRISRTDGTIGDGIIIYTPSEPAYAEVLAFIGGLKPGENKPMPRIGPKGDVARSEIK